VDDEVQPKPVDVTPKQEQARMAADANFESSSKAPEKRKEKELNEESTDATEPVSVTGADKVAGDTTAEKNPEQNAPTHMPKDTSSSLDTVANTAATSDTATPDRSAAQVKNDNADTASSATAAKTKATNNSNGNGHAPKTKKGSLDPNRFPDAGQDTATDTDSRKDPDA